MAITLRAGAGRTEFAASQSEVAAARVLVGQPLADAGEGADLVVPRELEGLVRSVIDAVARGESVTVGTLPDELSTSVAAEQLGISRPTLMALISKGELQAHKVGTHTRVRTADVVAFRKARLTRQREAFDRLRELDDELGL